ncbi:hypothetical protein ACWDA3_25135 [Nonomuraea rubra]
MSRLFPGGVRILAIGVALALSTSCGYVEQQRVTRSFAEMEQVARAIAPDDLIDGPRKVGDAEFQVIYREGDRVYFQLGENGPSVDPYGYVWSPSRVPVDDSNPSIASSFKHVQGHWYRWSDSY